MDTNNKIETKEVTLNEFINGEYLEDSFQKDFFSNKRDDDNFFLLEMKQLFQCPFVSLYKDKRYDVIPLDCIAYDIERDGIEYNVLFKNLFDDDERKANESERFYIQLYESYPCKKHFDTFYKDLVDSYDDKNFKEKSVTEKKRFMVELFIQDVMSHFVESVDYAIDHYGDNHPHFSYREITKLLESLAKLQNQSLPFEIELKFDVAMHDRKDVIVDLENIPIIDLQSIDLSDKCKEKLKDFLRENRAYSTGSNDLDNWLGIELITYELDREDDENLFANSQSNNKEEQDYKKIESFANVGNETIEKQKTNLKRKR